jgi:chemotaxis protein CheC
MPLTPAMEARIRSISEHCLHRAAASLGQLVSFPLRLTVEQIASLRPEALPEMAVGQSGSDVAAMQFEITGEEGGFLLIVFPFTTVHCLLHRLLPDAPPAEMLSPLEASAVEEVGNILASAFLSEMGDLLGRRVLPSPPRVQFERTAELIRDLSLRLRQTASEVVMVLARFEDPEDRIEGRFFVFPDLAALAECSQSREG